MRYLVIGSLVRGVTFSNLGHILRPPEGSAWIALYLGDKPAAWAGHGACALIGSGARVAELLVDQGLEMACAAAGIPLTLRRHSGYDHSYWCIKSIIVDHLRWHWNAVNP